MNIEMSSIEEQFSFDKLIGSQNMIYIAKLKFRDVCGLPSKEGAGAKVIKN